MTIGPGSQQRIDAVRELLGVAEPKSEKPPRDDLRGRRFGAWHVVRYVGYETTPCGTRIHFYTCLCDCGTLVPRVIANNLKRQKSKGCRSCANRIAQVRRLAKRP